LLLSHLPNVLAETLGEGRDCREPLPVQLPGDRQHLDCLLERDLVVARLLEELRHDRPKEALLEQDLLGDHVAHPREVSPHLPRHRPEGVHLLVGD